MTIDFQQAGVGFEADLFKIGHSWSQKFHFHYSPPLEPCITDDEITKNKRRGNLQDFLLFQIQYFSPAPISDLLIAVWWRALRKSHFRGNERQISNGRFTQHKEDKVLAVP